ncbi:MAG TPA: hypothetical protein EYP09_01105, partial [Anaerolineae bacterium]|nr:hypothetical protein [Anaerolineae bacterium]
MHTQLVLPGWEHTVPDEKPCEALSILQEMFDIIRESTGRDSRASFNQLVRFLADCLRIHPLPQEDREVAEKLLPLEQPNKLLQTFQQYGDWLRRLGISTVGALN